MAHETQILSEFGATQGSIADKKQLMTPSIHYHTSLTEVSQFLRNYWRGNTENGANLSQEIGQDGESLIKFQNILNDTLTNVNFTEEQKTLVSQA